MSYDLPSYEGWDCPTCMRPMEKEDDHECNTCGLNASEHLSVTSLCRILRDVSGREAALIVERDKLNSQLAAERDLLLDPHAVYINMLHGKIAKLDWQKLEHINGPHPLREQLAAERALADRLADALKACRCNAIVIQELRYGFDGDCGAIRHAGLIEDDCELVITAWKEARSE